MEKKQNPNQRMLINIGLALCGFVAGSVVWGPASDLFKSNQSAKEPANERMIEQFNRLIREPQANQSAGLVLTEQDKELIGKTAAQYLIDHPENLVEAGKRLEWLC